MGKKIERVKKNIEKVQKIYTVKKYILKKNIVETKCSEKISEEKYRASGKKYIEKNTDIGVKIDIVEKNIQWKK